MRLTAKALGRGLISARHRPDAYLSVAAACALIAGISLGAPDAAAQTSAVKSVFENYKLFGIFAFDCSKPVSGENYYYVHRMIDPDHAERDRMSGENTRDFVDVIDKAVAIGPDQVRVSGTRAEGNRKGEPIEELYRVEANRVTTLEATISGGKVISGGLFNGHQVPWAYRCPAADAPPSQASATMPPPPAQSGSPGAGCQTENYTFSTVRSQSATTNSVSNGGAACSYTVAPVHPDQVEFTSASIVEPPRNGTFEQTGSFAFRYQPNSGFRGADEYAVKVCGHNNQSAGCAVVTYRVTVR